MSRKWTREQIIRQILKCEAEGLPMSVGEPGVSQALYQAGTRIFGSWRNAIQAAGVRPDRGNSAEKWPPARILLLIRNLARRKNPLNTTELERRYGSMLSAARRLFGSWSKAVVAAGVDPEKLRRKVPWTRERVIEAILTRVLRNEDLNTPSSQLRSLMEAGQRFFGSWTAALASAGLDPAAITSRSPTPANQRAVAPAPDVDFVHWPRQPWTREMVIAAILTRLRHQKPLNSQSLSTEDPSLYRAATRRFSSWSSALLAAGLDPDDHQRQRGRESRTKTRRTSDEPSAKSQLNDVVRRDSPP